ncbi:hypothetical protein SCACP_28110 [Sporomusa carbonis]|uniref:hypothetical protein n=1 Tax=Sporomusa carbonis TaxID=3076075 RepID=UPI003A65F0EF
MNKKIAVYVMGGLLTVSAIGFGFANITSAAEKNPPAQMMQSNQMDNMMGNMDPKAMAEMMKSPEMQKQCVEMMKNPEMQGMMKQMLQQDMAFHQMMADLVNSVDMNSDHTMQPQQQQPAVPEDDQPTDHSVHHG